MKELSKVFCLRTRCVLVCSLIGFVGGISESPSWAADTVETFAANSFDAELYFGVGDIQLGTGAESPAVPFGELIVGYGLIDRLSLQVGATLTGHESLAAEGLAGGYLCVFGTPLDTGHFDVDLLFTVGLGGAAFNEVSYEPATEINFDLSPDMNSAGFYARASFPVSKIKSSESGDDVTFDFVGIWGAYITIATKHQILVEYNTTCYFNPGDDAPCEVGGIAFGYNVTLNDWLELIHHVEFDLDQNGGWAAFGGMLGLILTLPKAE